MIVDSGRQRVLEMGGRAGLAISAWARSTERNYEDSVAIGQWHAHAFQDLWDATISTRSDSAWIRWSGATPSSSIWVRKALNIVSGASTALTSASAIASGETRSIQATLRPKALAPQASQGLEETNSTSAGATC